MQAGRREDGPNEEKEFYDPETANSSGTSHVSSQPSSIASPRGMTSRDSCLPHYTRNSMGTSGNVFFENPPAQERISPSSPSDPNNLASSCRAGVLGIAMRRSERRTAEVRQDSKIYLES